MIPNYQKEVTCIYCRRPFSDLDHNLTKTKDHIIPKYLGGINSTGNYVAACHECNRMKANRSLPDFAGWLTKEYKNHQGGYLLWSIFPDIARRAWKLYNKTSKMHKKYLKD